MSKVKPGRRPKGGVRHSIRFGHPDVYQHALEVWEKLGFDSFSSYVDFTFSLVHGKWREFGFPNADAAADYLLAIGRGETIPPPHLRPCQQDALPLEHAAA
ncbi:hypothetical protein SAMN05421505_17012 [Sinosporangium album]|uniref:Uncharacterized protein n=1 Tax=Sinosporangium album TaxID=504805 RepID=A0A1G8LL04_9ACTN|nr:hypothetical protein [Sinosporangium album]SDI56402.1 hypothetical protein SAMN05421505_17012 [Sinosporangium album]